MTIENLVIGAGNCDAVEYGSGGMAVATSNMLLNLNGRMGAWRFQSYAPQGATIDSAALSVYINNSSYLNPQGDFYGLDADNIAEWNSDTPSFQITQYSFTTASLDWTTNVSATGYYEHDVTAMIQEIVNRSGWAAGNWLGLVYKIDADTNFRLPQYDNGVSGQVAKLDIDYTAPASGPAAAAYQQTAQGIALGARRGL